MSLKSTVRGSLTRKRRASDLILAMEARHIEEMEAMAPEAEYKMHAAGFAAGVDGYRRKHVRHHGPVPRMVENTAWRGTRSRMR